MPALNRSAETLWRFAPVAVVLLAALFRFAGLDAVRHSYDNGYQIYDAVRLLDGAQWPVIGQPSSVFLDNPPLMAYLLSIPLLLWRSPWSAYIFVTLLNTIAVYFVYALGRELKGRPFALLAALLFAINPWIVHYSRFTWTQGLLPFFLALAAWGLWPAMVSERPAPRRTFAGFLAVAAMIQTYVLALAILAPLALLLLVFRRRLSTRAVAAGLAVVLLALLAYAAGLATRWQPNLEKLQRFTTAGQESASLPNVEALQHALRLVTAFEYQAPGETVTAPPLLNALMYTVHLLLLLALLAGVAHALLALRLAGDERRLALTLLVWLLLPVFGFALLPLPIHPHYLLLTLPAGQFLAAWGLSSLASVPRARLLLAPLLLLFTLVFALALRTTTVAARAAPVAADDLDRWTLSAAARFGRAIRQESAAATYPGRIAAPGNDVLLSSASAVYLQVISGLDYPDFVLLPEQQPLLYVLPGRNLQPGALGAREQQRPAALEFPGVRVSFVRADPYSRAASLNLAQTPLDWPTDSGLALLGYDLSPRPNRAGSHLALTTYWRVDERPAGHAAWYVGAYYQILDQAWQMQANVAGHGQWARRWADGDTYIERLSLPLPEEPGEYQLLIGLNDPIHGQSFNLLAPDGPRPFLIVPLLVTSP